MLAYPIWAVRLAVWWLRDRLRRVRRAPAHVALLLEAPPPEPDPPPVPGWQRWLARPPLSVQGLARALRAIAADGRVRTLVLHLRPLALTAAQVDALRELLAEVRAAGVRVVCWAPSYTGATYQVACAADEVLLQPGGIVAPLGLVREYVFLAGALERLGMSADFVQVSPYKTAGDMLTRRSLTPEAREMADWLADAAYTERVAAVAAGQGLDEAAARKLVEGSPYTDAQALAAGAVDALVNEEELPGRIGGDVRPWAAARRRLPRPRPRRPGRSVALLRVEGMIVDGRSRRAPIRPPVLPLLLQDQCGDLTVVEQARALALDRRVGAVVVWVDSGGGSASASESMASALAALGRRKPVVAAMGSVAASGGYYVTTAAARVFAHPGTVTGSIGVLAGKLVAGGLLDRLLLGRELVLRGEHSAMWGAEAPFTEAERRKVEELVQRSYGLFLDRVAAARKRPVVDVEAVAGGRVWTGAQAFRHGLIDELGGLDRAIAAARELGGLPADALVREVRRGRRELTPLPAAAPAVLEHALRAVAALRQAGAWWLCPLVGQD